MLLEFQLKTNNLVLRYQIAENGLFWGVGDKIMFSGKRTVSGVNHSLELKLSKYRKDHEIYILFQIYILKNRKTNLCRLMSIKRRQLFVGVLDNGKWTNEKLCAYINKHASTNDDQYIVDCQIMSYNDTRFDGRLVFNY